MVNNVDTAPIIMGGDSSGIDIPGGMISKADGALLKARLSETVTVTLDKETVTLDLTEKTNTDGVQFDRFGLFAPGVGGSKVKIFFDDLDYTAK